MEPITFNTFLKVVERDFGSFNKRIKFNFEQFAKDFLEDDATIISVKSSIKDRTVTVVLRQLSSIPLYNITRFYHNKKHWAFSFDLSDGTDIDVINYLLHSGNMDNVAGFQELYHNID